jgi:hypothetical protein
MIADAGFWIGLDHGDRRAWARLEVLRREGLALLTSAAVVAEVWRGGPRQSRLAVALRSADVAPLTDPEAREVGVLLGRHGGDDVADGHLALLAGRHPSRAVATGDRRDLEALGVAAERIVET